jgi:hypothetical protein
VPSFIRRIFHKKTLESHQPPPVDVSSSMPETNIVLDPGVKAAGSSQISLPANLPLETPQILVGVAQSIGIQRDSNEDSLFTLTTNLISNGRTITFGLYIIADGMGGHEKGELASNIGVSRLSTYVIDTFLLRSISP